MPNPVNIQSQQGNRYRMSLYEQDQSRRNNFIARESVQSSQINRSQTKRKHKIFSLSSKPSKEITNQKIMQTNPLVEFPHHSGYTGNLIKQQMSINQEVSILQEQSKPQSPQIIKQKKQIGQRLNQHNSLHVQCKKVRNTKQNSKEGHLKFDMGIKKSKDYRLDLENQKQEVQKMSIIDHLVTIPGMKEKAKLKPSGQIKSMVESEYVPSPEELSTILRTIEKQSRDARKVRSAIEKRKSVYQRKINNSIRYHEQNFDKYQQSNEPTEMVKGRSNEHQQFVPVHPKVFGPSLGSENPLRVMLSYLDVQSQKYNF